MQRKRPLALMLMCSVEEKSEWQHKAEQSGMNLSCWMRIALDRAPVLAVVAKEEVS